MIDSSYNDTYISDMSGDKLHPAHNNICSFFFDPLRNYGVQQNANVQYVNSRGETFMTSYIHFTFDSLYRTYKSLGLDLENIGRFGAKKVEHLKLMNKIIRSSAQSLASYKMVADAIQYSQRYNKKYTGENEINFRSGESAYFSSMMYYKQFSESSFLPNIQYHIGPFSDVPIDHYIASQRSLNTNTLAEFNESATSNRLKLRENLVLTCVSDRLVEFIFNENNTYELIIVRKSDGKTFRKNLDLNNL